MNPVDTLTVPDQLNMDLLQTELTETFARHNVDLALVGCFMASIDRANEIALVGFNYNLTDLSAKELKKLHEIHMELRKKMDEWFRSLPKRKT
jgi:hypothetical protein